MIALADCVRFLDETLSVGTVPDYDQALNGLQLQNGGTVHRVATAVDFSTETIHRAIAEDADLLVVHHGMFWGGTQPFVAHRYDRLRLAIEHDLAVYAVHLPLDLHPTLGNNARLAAVLGLVSSGGFGRFRSIEVGLSGQADISTVDLFDRIRAFAEPLGTHVVATAVDLSRRTKSWGIISGAGASSATLQEAAERGLDTLIVGEGPHHTAVEARERGLAVVYAGHYATETLGVQALGDELARGFSLPWSFLHIPTGL